MSAVSGSKRMCTFGRGGRAGAVATGGGAVVPTVAAGAGGVSSDGPGGVEGGSGSAPAERATRDDADTTAARMV